MKAKKNSRTLGRNSKNSALKAIVSPKFTTEMMVKDINVVKALKTTI